MPSVFAQLALLAPVIALVDSADLARPSGPAAERSKRLSSDPYVWLTHGFLDASTIKHMRSLVPKDEKAYSPCIGQVDEFEFKRCTFLPVAGDKIMEDIIVKVAKTWDVDTSRLSKGLPLIRYLPGSPPVGKHGDEDRRGVVPNATLVLYMTDPDMVGGVASGQTIFEEAGLKITPEPGSILSFQNVNAAGAPHPKGKHYVSAVPKDAPDDRLVVQIPIAVDKIRKYAYPEHVSGAKKPGQHESLHGTAEQINAYKAAVAAGMGIAIAYMAAKAGKWDPADVPELEKEAKGTGKFADEDF